MKCDGVSLCFRSAAVWGHQSLHAQGTGWAGVETGWARHCFPEGRRWGGLLACASFSFVFHWRHKPNSLHRQKCCLVFPCHLVKPGATGRGCEMEREAGSQLAAPQRSPTPQSWRTTFSAWRGCAKKPTSKQRTPERKSGKDGCHSLLRFAKHKVSHQHITTEVKHQMRPRPVDISALFVSGQVDHLVWTHFLECDLLHINVIIYNYYTPGQQWPTLQLQDLLVGNYTWTGVLPCPLLSHCTFHKILS